jgi:hypothetical protein
MTTAYTSLLGLALPVTGELSGTWGDTVNNSITSLLDSAIAGTTTLSADTTLTTTTGASNQARQAILLCTGHSANITITAPAQSKIYTVINASATYTVKIRGVGPTTGITIPVSSTATVAWNGSDFVDATNYINGNITLGSGTANGVAYLNGSKVLTTGSALVFDGTNLGVGVTPSAWNNIFKAVQINAQGCLMATSATMQMGNNIFYDGAYKFIGTGYASRYYQATGQHVWTVSTASGTAGGAITETQAMTLDASGNLGVGVTSPVSRIDVRAASATIDQYQQIQAFSTNTSAAIDLGGGIGLGGFYNSTQIATFGTIVGRKENGTSGNYAGYLAFGTNAQATGVVERMRIDSSGNVGIGTTSPNLGGLLRALTLNTPTGGNYSGVELAGAGTLSARFVTNNAAGTFIGSQLSIPLIFETNATERARFNTTGAFVLAGGTTTADGIGITFPATQSASTNANTLDDYEEGTWTPTITRSSSNPTVTYTGQNGSYVKIGRSVFLTCGMNWSANSGGTGTFLISGLPFTNSSTAAHYSQAFCVDYSGITFAVGTTTLGGYVNVNDTRVFLTCGGSAVTSSGPTLGGSGYLYMSVTYIASA